MLVTTWRVLTDALTVAARTTGTLWAPWLWGGAREPRIVSASVAVLTLFWSNTNTVPFLISPLTAIQNYAVNHG